MMRANVAVSNLTAMRRLALFGAQIVPRRVLVGEGGGRRGLKPLNAKSRTHKFNTGCKKNRSPKKNWRCHMSQAACWHLRWSS